MDLALALGMPVRELRLRMTERELSSWRRYAAKKALPNRRLELGMAQITAYIARTMGGVENAAVADFLFDPPKPKPRIRARTAAPPPAAMDVAAAFGGKVRVLGMKRKG